MKSVWKTKVAMFTGITAMTVGILGSGVASEPAFASSSKVVHLTYWNMWSGIWTQVVQKMVNQFNATHPDIQVQMLSVPSSNGEQKLLTSIAAGDPPDVFTEWNPYVAAMAQQNALMNLNKFMVGKYAGLKHWFYPVASRWGTYKGQMYAMPWTMNTFLLYYNKTMMKDAGLNPNKPPKTIAQLEQEQAKMWKFGSGHTVQQIGFYPSNADWDKYMPMFGVTAGQLYNGKKYTMTGKGAKSIMNFYAYFKKYPFSQVSAFQKGLSGAAGGSTDPFEIGKQAFMITGMWEIPTIKQENPSLQYGAEPIPAAPGGHPNTTWVNGNFNEIPKGSKHPQQAFEFIAWLSGYDNAKWAASAYPTGGWIPNSPQITKQPAYQKFLNSDPLQKPFVNVMLNPNDQITPVTPIDMYFEQSMQTNVDNVLQGKVSPQQALQQWQTQLNKQLVTTTAH